jgi:hypothetical protein
MMLGACQTRIASALFFRTLTLVPQPWLESSSGMFDFLRKRGDPILTRVPPVVAGLIVLSLPVGFRLTRELFDDGALIPFFYATFLGDMTIFPLTAVIGSQVVRSYDLLDGKWGWLYRWPRLVSGVLYLIILVPIYLNWKNGTTMEALPEELRNLVSEWLHTLVSPAIGVALLRLMLAAIASKAPWKVKLPVALLPIAGFGLGLYLDTLQGK